MSHPESPAAGAELPAVSSGPITVGAPSVDVRRNGCVRIEEEVLTNRVLEDGRGARREVSITDDLWEYLKYESARRGLSTLEIYEEEEAAGKAIEALGITEAVLDEAIRRSNPPAKYLEADEECPF